MADHSLEDELRPLLAQGRKVEAVKRYQEARGCCLMEAMEAVEAIALAAKDDQPPSPFEDELLRLLEAGQKIEAIRRYRQRSGCGLKEAKDAVEALARKRGVTVPAKAGCSGVMLLVALGVTLVALGAWAASNHLVGGSQPAPPAPAAQPLAKVVDLSGRWLLTLPAGFEHHVRIRPLGDGGYRVAAPGKGLNGMGVYACRGDRLELTEPAIAGQKGFIWKIHNANVLILVEQETRGTGASYVDATLSRQVNWPALEENKEPGEHTAR